MYISTNWKKKVNRDFDFLQDLDCIWSSFYLCYRIDILKENLKYKYFIILFKNLPKTAPICEIIALRKMNPSDIKSIELRKYRESVLLKNENSDALATAMKIWTNKKV